jgi:hypothetical protein
MEIMNRTKLEGEGREELPLMARRIRLLSRIVIIERPPNAKPFLMLLEAGRIPYSAFCIENPALR